MEFTTQLEMQSQTFRLYNATARTTLSSTYRSITLYAELFQETWL
jgi:hypothetical protein